MTLRLGMGIGILTFHRCINYGAYWQARCLVEAIRERGHRVYLLDYRSLRAQASGLMGCLARFPAQVVLGFQLLMSKIGKALLHS